MVSDVVASMQVCFVRSDGTEKRIVVPVNMTIGELLARYKPRALAGEDAEAVINGAAASEDLELGRLGEDHVRLEVRKTLHWRPGPRLQPRRRRRMWSSGSPCRPCIPHTRR